MNMTWIILIVLAALALFAVLFVVGIYNKLVGLRNRFKNAFAQIDVQLKQRYDLIPNLVETAKGYLKHERDTLGDVFIGSVYKTFALAKGGSAVAESLGARLILAESSDSDERKRRNVVEEMAIAAGVPVPKIYVLPEEQGINAFAAGHTPKDAAIAVTRGCLTLLNRDELQGDIGHEFSHILNGDMRLYQRIMGVIFGIVCLSVIGGAGSLIHSPHAGEASHMFFGNGLGEPFFGAFATHPPLD